jgi:hypothetical protein
MAIQSIIRPSSLASNAAAIAIAVAAAAPFAANSAGLGPQSYVQSGLVTQFDAIDNEGTGTHNPSATTWRDLKGSAYITFQSGASWTDRYFDNSNVPHSLKTMPSYLLNSFTVELALRVVSYSGSYPRPIGNGDTTGFYFQSGHIYLITSWYTPRPHSSALTMGTLTGYSDTTGRGLVYNGVLKDSTDTATAATSCSAADWAIGGASSSAPVSGHYYAVRFYNRPLSPAEIATNAVIDKMRFWSFKYEYSGVEEHWADIMWEAPESTAANPPFAPGNTTNDYVQIIGARVTVDAGDNIGLMGLSLEDGATLSIPSGERVAVKVLYVEGQPVKRGLYSANSANGIAAAWLSGDGVVAVAGATDADIPTGTYIAPDANGWYVFGRPSADGGATAYHSGAQKWYIRGERTDWEKYWFPEGSKLKLVGYVILKTIPAGVFSVIDLSEAEHILLCEDKAFSDGSALAVPSGVEFRYQPVTSMSYDAGNGNYYLLSVGDSPEAGDLEMNGTLRIYGDGGGLLNSQQYTGDISGTGTIQFGNFNKAARFSGAFTFKGTATGFNNASLLWVDSLDVDASLGDVTLNNGGSYTGNTSLNANGIFFGKNGSGETANGKLDIGVLDGQARNTALRGGGALAVWGGNTIHVEKLKSALHVVGRPQDLGCTWSWFGSASAVGAGNVEIDDADFIGNIYLSTNVNMTVGDVSSRVTFDYSTYLSDAVNATTLDITNSCNVGASVQATDLAMLPSRLSGFKGSVTLTDTATKSYGVLMDFMHGTNSLYNIGGCIGSGTLVAAPANGTINVTFNTPQGQEPVEGRYAVASFSSGGDLLRGWSVTLNGSPEPFARIGNYYVSVRRDSTTGLWLKVTKIRGTMFVVQ